MSGHTNHQSSLHNHLYMSHLNAVHRHNCGTKIQNKGRVVQHFMRFLSFCPVLSAFCPLHFSSISLSRDELFPIMQAILFMQVRANALGFEDPNKNNIAKCKQLGSFADIMIVRYLQCPLYSAPGRCYSHCLRANEVRRTESR